MPLICFTSPKGGVGRTTAAATVAVAMQRIGWRVVAIDLDRQNALRLNFDLPEELPGIGSDGAADGDWSQFAVETPAGVLLVPYGAVTASEALRMQSQIGQDPGWLRDRLAPFLDQRDMLVVADMPASPTAVNLELDAIADLHLLMLLADAMSLALLPKLQQGDYLLGADDRMPRLGYVLNQVEPRWQLCRDVLALSRDVLGDALYGIVHRDEGVAEAAACQLTVLDYAPDSVASQDITAIARRIHAALAPA
jgi:cellulose synthase operon protein YhjQ